MQDQRPNTPGQIELTEVTAVSEVDDPAQLASIYPCDFASRNRNDVLVSTLDGGRSNWRVAVGFVAVFGLGWAGGSNAYRFPNIETAFNPLPQQVKSSPGNPDSKMKSAARIDGPVRNTISEAGLQASNLLKVASPAASMSNRAQKPSPGATQPGAATSSSVVEPANRTLPADLVTQREAMVAAPETRPTTIDGWTVRDVHGGTAVLEGPDGVWTAARGDTVPGVGRIDSIVRWGNRWIVATASGLIATP
jgi:hypothetical protein